MQTIYVLDFEEILRNFKPYHESLNVINGIKTKFSDKIEDYKKEMNSLVNVGSKFMLDKETQKNNSDRIKEIQTEAMEAENEYRNTAMETQNSEMEKNIKQVSDIVDEWVATNSAFNPIDIIINRNIVVFVKDNYDITETIMGIVKEKGLYQKYEDIPQMQEVDL